MIWKIVIIVLCLLWWLPIGYVWHKTKFLKKYEDYLDEENDRRHNIIDAYNYATRDMQKEFYRVKDSVEEQRKIVNGWAHKIDIMDREIRKLKKATFSQPADNESDGE